jgi:hypothetical protein
MQSNPVPASVFYGKGNNLIARVGKRVCKRKKFGAVLHRLHFKFNQDGAFHVPEKIPRAIFNFNMKKEEQRFLPALKNGVSALSAR